MFSELINLALLIGSNPAKLVGCGHELVTYPRYCGGSFVTSLFFFSLKDFLRFGHLCYEEQGMSARPDRDDLTLRNPSQ